MAAEGGCIDLMFLGPPYPATGSATNTYIAIHHSFAEPKAMAPLPPPPPPRTNFFSGFHEIGGLEKNIVPLWEILDPPLLRIF